jgi:hypothetical protein
VGDLGMARLAAGLEDRFLVGRQAKICSTAAWVERSLSVSSIRSR